MDGASRRPRQPHNKGASMKKVNSILLGLTAIALPTCLAAQTAKDAGLSSLPSAPMPQVVQTQGSFSAESQIAPSPASPSSTRPPQMSAPVPQPPPAGV